MARDALFPLFCANSSSCLRSIPLELPTTSAMEFWQSNCRSLTSISIPFSQSVKVILQLQAHTPLHDPIYLAWVQDSSGRWSDEHALPLRRGYEFGRNRSVGCTRWVSLECGGLTPLAFAVAWHRAPIDSFSSFQKAIVAATIDIGSMSRRAATGNGGVKPPHSKGPEPPASI